MPKALSHFVRLSPSINIPQGVPLPAYLAMRLYMIAKSRWWDRNYQLGIFSESVKGVITYDDYRLGNRAQLLQGPEFIWQDLLHVGSIGSGVFFNVMQQHLLLPWYIHRLSTGVEAPPKTKQECKGNSVFLYNSCWTNCLPHEGSPAVIQWCFMGRLNMDWMQHDYTLLHYCAIAQDGHHTRAEWSIAFNHTMCRAYEQSNKDKSCWTRCLPSQMVLHDLFLRCSKTRSSTTDATSNVVVLHSIGALV